MAVFKCKMCGANLNIEGDSPIVTCEYCDTTQTIPSLDNEKKLNLFNRANRLRINGEFDKAATIYESIVAEFPEEAEAYWGLVICNYGIEYVDDPLTAKKIPTCHRASYVSIKDDENYNLALEYADLSAQKVYHDEAREIDRICKKIIDISKNEQPYDIFICYKETDENGDRTIDSVIAQDVYDKLTEHGYRVFFSRISLEDKIGKEYEPYIFSALNSAKVMLCFGTKYEYFHTVWVKNEWSRFLKLIAMDNSKAIVPCYKNIDPYDLPDEFQALQAQDMSKVGAVQDLIRGIDKLFGNSNGGVGASKTVYKQGPSAAEPLVKRALLFMETGDFDNARDYFERSLDVNPENGRAYLGLLLCGLSFKKQEDLLKLSRVPTNNFYLDMFYRFSNDTEKKALDDIFAKIEERNQNKLYQKYNRALDIVNVPVINVHDWNEAKEILDSIIDFKNSKELLIKLNERKKEIFNIKGINRVISAGDYNTIGININNQVVCTDLYSKLKGLSDVKAVSSTSHSVALLNDGRIFTSGMNSYGRCNVNNWQNVSDIATGYSQTVALLNDGHIISTDPKMITTTSNAVMVDCGVSHIVFLSDEGEVSAIGFNEKGQSNVDGWDQCVSIAAGNFTSFGVTIDGRVLAVGDNSKGQCNVSNWTDIISVSANIGHTIGLRSDGTVVATGDNKYGQCNVQDWADIAYVSAGRYHTIGVRKDGYVVATGSNADGQCNVQGWRLKV